MEDTLESAIGTVVETPSDGFAVGEKSTVRWKKLLFDLFLVIGFLLLSSWLVRP
jgi:flagellar biogenesis protein FliO